MRIDSPPLFSPVTFPPDEADHDAANQQDGQQQNSDGAGTSLGYSFFGSAGSSNILYQIQSQTQGQDAESAQDAQSTHSAQSTQSAPGAPSASAANTPLYGASGEPQPEDIAQGQVGDCYLLSSLGALAARQPQAIQNAIHYNASDKTYTVTLYKPNAKGEPEPETVTVTQADIQDDQANQGVGSGQQNPDGTLGCGQPGHRIRR